MDNFTKEFVAGELEYLERLESARITRSRLTEIENRLGWGGSDKWPVDESIRLWACSAEKILNERDALAEKLKMVAKICKSTKHANQIADILKECESQQTCDFCGKPIIGNWKEIAPAVSAPRQIGVWREITSAPKDRLVDIWTGTGRIVNCYWDAICQEWRTTTPAGFLFCFKHATHWMNPPVTPEQSVVGKHT